jgi:hypothetical protein
MMNEPTLLETDDITRRKVDNPNGQDVVRLVIGTSQIFGLQRDEILPHAVSASSYLHYSTKTSYINRVIQWALEFKSRKHRMSQEEVSAVNSDIFFELLDSQE